MELYFAEILKNDHTIIVPDFGALNLTNAESGEILFMPYLKFDDGNLRKFVAEKENISQEEAKKKIAEFVKEWENELENGQNISIPPFGFLEKNESGEIEFKKRNESVTEEITVTLENQFSEQEQNVKKEKLSVPEEPQIPEQEPEVVNEEIFETEEISEEPKIIPIIPDEVSNEERVIEIEEIPEIENIEQINKVDQLEDEIILEETSVNEYVPETATMTKGEVYSTEEQWKDDLDVPPLNVKIERPKKPILEKTKKDKKRRSPMFYFLLIFFFLIVASTLTIAMFYNSLEKYLPFTSSHEPKEINSIEKKTVKPVTIEKKEVVVKKKDEIKIQEEIPKKEVQSQESPESADGFVTTSTASFDRNHPFHIIGGAFADKSNADRYQSKLKEADKESVIIGKFDNLYLVSISSHASLELANFEMESARSISQKAWIFKFP